jgi:RNA polymerase sigma factor (sigma-70 family)
VVTPEQRERMRTVLSHVLEQLTSEERRIVDLLMAGLSVSQIAQELGTTYSAAGVRIHRLRQTLPKLL